MRIARAGRRAEVEPRALHRSTGRMWRALRNGDAQTVQSPVHEELASSWMNVQAGIHAPRGTRLPRMDAPLRKGRFRTVTRRLARTPGAAYVPCAMNVDELRARVAAVRERIEAARARAGRSDPVTLVAVTKTHPAAVVRAAIEAGIADVGENRVQEMDDKVAEIGRSAVRWHLIGHLQRNKAPRAAAIADLVHSLDSVRLAQALSAEAVKAGIVLPVLVQVNTSGEESKFGLSPDQAVDAVGRMAELPGLRLEGMMTMAPFTDDQAVIRRTFSGARRLRDEAERQVPAFTGRHLSMGMSNDFEAAVEEGSTLVRVGSTLFGERGP
jgi:pyridoxal phosphate enzyme (YggS family)